MKPRIPPSELVGKKPSMERWALCIAGTFLALAVSAPARSQEPSESIAGAARNVRQQKSNSATPSKIITNDDLGVQDSAPSNSALPQVSSPTARTESPKPRAEECKNPDAERLKTDLQAAQEELDQIHRELSYHPTVISDGDVDLKNFQPGSAGLNVGTQPVPQTEPLSPARVTEVILEEKISSMKKALTIACDSPEDAGIQKELDQAERELQLLRNEFALDQTTYYSKPNYADDAAGKARLDAEQERIQYLQSEVQRLKDELAASNSNQILK